MPPRRSGALNEYSPKKIFLQILALQAIYYVAATIFILFTCVVMGTTFSLDLIFGWDALRGDTTTGWMLGFVWLSCAFVSIIALLMLIQRSKLVPDFALTLHGIHLLLVTAYSRTIPANSLWWGLQFVSAAFMTMGGIYACRWRELKPISFGGHAPRSGENAGLDTPLAGETGGDDEAGFVRGSGRGRGRDGAGSYEMVELQEAAAEKENGKLAPRLD